MSGPEPDWEGDTKRYGLDYSDFLSDIWGVDTKTGAFRVDEKMTPEDRAKWEGDLKTAKDLLSSGLDYGLGEPFAVDFVDPYGDAYREGDLIPFESKVDIAKPGLDPDRYLEAGLLSGYSFGDLSESPYVSYRLSPDGADLEAPPDMFSSRLGEMSGEVPSIGTLESFKDYAGTSSAYSDAVSAGLAEPSRFDAGVVSPPSTVSRSEPAPPTAAAKAYAEKMAEADRVARASEAESVDLAIRTAAAAAEAAKAKAAAAESAASAARRLEALSFHPGRPVPASMAPTTAGHTTSWEGGRHGGSVTRDAKGAVVSSFSSDFASDDFMAGTGAASGGTAGGAPGGGGWGGIGGDYGDAGGR